MVTIEVTNENGCPAVSIAFAGAHVPARAQPLRATANCSHAPSEDRPAAIDVIVAAPRSARILTRAGDDGGPARRDGSSGPQAYDSVR